MKIQQNIYKIIKQNKSKVEEKGIALIMTLGVLSMLLVLALAFASNARIERKAANNNANTKKATLIAQGGLERVLALANLATIDSAVQQYGTGDTDWLKKLTTYNTDKEVIFDYADYIADGEPYGTIKWTYVKVDTNGDGNDDKIIGRFAYAVVGNPTFIDPAACVEQGTGAQNENGLNEERFGINVHEMNLGNLFQVSPSLSFSAAQVGNFSSVKAGGKLADVALTNAPIPGEATWASNDVMCSAANVNITGDLKTKCRDDWFIYNASPDPEAFWVDSNDDGKRDDTSELFHRLNLYRFTDGNSNGMFDTGEANWWNDPDSDGIITNNAGFISDSDRAAWDSSHTSANATGGINWFNSFTDATHKGTFASIADRKHQIAANLIDYCDDDDGDNDPLTNTTPIPTSNVHPNTWTHLIRPLYTGNEKTQYINEVYVEIKVDQKQTTISGTPDKYKNEYDIKADLYVETATIYDTGNLTKPLDDVTVKVSGKYKYSCANADGTYITTLADGSLKYDSSASSDSVWVEFNNLEINQSSSYDLNLVKDFVVKRETENFIQTPGWISAAIDSTSNTSPEVTDFVIQIDSVEIEIDGNGVDYAKIDSGEQAISTLGSGTNAYYAAFDWQVEDPRQNLNSGDWTLKAYPPNTVAPANGTDYSTALNNIINGVEVNPKNSGKDTETIEKVVDSGAGEFISTAHIANKPIECPWEIGAIHRGAKWETLNIDKYNTNGAMGAYDDGDANILDQIKMTDRIEISGKFNVNCGDKDSLRVLTMGIYTGNPYNDPTNTGGAVIDQSGADIIANAIYALKDATGSTTKRGTWNRRSEVTQTAALSDFGTTDAKKEELIGKFINLCKAGTSGTTVGVAANVIVLAQAIQDIGGVTLSLDLNGDGVISSSAPDTYDADGDGDTSDTINEENVSTTLGTYDSMFDKIISESKIVGKIYQDASDNYKWKLSNYMYVDE